MKKLISKLVPLLLCLGIFLWLPAKTFAADGDEIRAAKKIISVVYDDSGSMEGDRWVYANYATQALTALLNEQDELYITYMSRSTSSSEIDLSNIAAAVKNIRNWPHSAGTPGESLDTAKNRLDSISESDESTQFWLVILTDGEIDMEQTIQEKLNSFKGSRMSNGSTLNIAYLAMGPGAVSANADKGHGLYTYVAADSASISTTMSEIANLISGRLAADNVKQVDDRTITFHSDLPLYSISVLSQSSSAKVAAASSAEQPLNINRNIALDAFDLFKATELTLFGNAAVINLESGSGVSQVIPAGTYTITFTEPVRKDDLVVQYEPAIGLKILLTRGGVEITDTSVLQEGDQIAAEIIPVVPGTDDPIDPSSLPKGVDWKLEYFVDDQSIDSVAASKIPRATVSLGDHTIRGTMAIPGFAPSLYHIHFHVEPFVLNLGIQADQPHPLAYYRKSAGEGSIDGGSLTFRITNDGVVLSREELKDLDVKLEVIDVVCDNSTVEGFLNRFGNVPAKCTLHLEDDGSYVLSPVPVVPFTAFLMMAGDYTVTVAIEGDSAITATGTFTMVPQLSDWIDLSILVAILLLLGYLIYIFFIKYKFTGQVVCYEVFRPNSTGGSIEVIRDADSLVLKPFTWNLLLPKRACEAKFYGLTLQAGPDGTVIITGKSIAKAVSYYGSSSARPTTALRAIQAVLQSTELPGSDGRTETTASDQSLTAELPIYFRSEGDRNIWRLRLQE